MTDALERLIDERARAILAAEKAEVARAEIEAKREVRHEQLKATVTRLRFELERNRRWQVTPTRLSRLRAGTYAVLICVFGLFTHYVACPLLHWTPASLACPATCQGCEPSMRILYRNTSSGNSSSLSDFNYVCRNRKVAVDQVDLDDLKGARAAELAPYTMNGFLVALIETVMGLLVLVPFLRWRGRLADRREEQELATKLVQAEAEQKAFEGGEAAAPPYR